MTAASPSRVDVALAVAFGGEVHHVDHAGQRWVVTDDGADGPGQVLAHVVRAGAVPLAVERPSVRLAAAENGPARFRRQVEAQQLVVAFGNLLRRGAVAVFLGEAGDFVVEDIRQALEEEERQQVVLELGGVLLAANGAGGVPQHLLHGLGGGHGGAPPGTPPGHLRGGFGVVCSGFGNVDAGLRGQGVEAIRAARCGAVTPSSQRLTVVNETPQPVGKLLLREVQAGADGAQGGIDGCVCYVCHVCTIADIRGLSSVAPTPLAPLIRGVGRKPQVTGTALQKPP